MHSNKSDLEVFVAQDEEFRKLKLRFEYDQRRRGKSLPKKSRVWDEDEAVELAQEAFIRRCEPEI